MRIPPPTPREVVVGELDVPVELADVGEGRGIDGGQRPVEGLGRRGDSVAVARVLGVVLRRGHEPHERDLVLEPAEDLERAVSGAVVDDQPEVRRARLALKAPGHHLDVRRLVADRRDDQDVVAVGGHARVPA